MTCSRTRYTIVYGNRTTEGGDAESARRAGYRLPEMLDSFDCLSNGRVELSAESQPATLIRPDRSGQFLRSRIKGYTRDSLDGRIESAAKDHLIPAGVAKWAHDVGLDGNNQRHADENAPLQIRPRDPGSESGWSIEVTEGADGAGGLRAPDRQSRSGRG